MDGNEDDNADDNFNEDTDYEMNSDEEGVESEADDVEYLPGIPLAQVLHLI